MYFQQFYLSCLAHASYLLGSEGIAAVVDPQRDVDIYLEEARTQGLRIAYVIETHLHADFVSGHRELAERTGAQIVVGAKAGAEFPHKPVKEGDEIRFGQCVLRFLETPGHTLESLCVLVTDLERSPEPWAVLTGDTLFIGDVGRPDLSPVHTPQELAGMLYDSLHHKLLALPDDVEVYPAHGAGSLCGRNISPERQSTIGKERKYNYALQPMSREEFIRMLTSETAERPDYFLEDAELNRRGAAPLSQLPALPALPPEKVLEQQQNGTVVLDTRSPAAFGAGHVPGSLNIPLSGQYASWAGTLIGLDRPIILVAEDPERLEESRLRLARVGIEKVAGYLAGGILGWQKAGFPLAEVPQISVHDLQAVLLHDPASVQVVDVRRPGEWKAGHIAQAIHKSLIGLKPLLAAAAGSENPVAELDPARPVVVHCKSGYRSSIAAGLLQRAGFQNVMNVVGGFDAWQKQNLPVVKDEPHQASAAS
jgi:glyoxylase-like metal-dependent hydrolase (beta-lactamase superfamily II)/rhodanese-related sulfurtransferase